MTGRPVAVALLETGDSFLFLEKQRISHELADEIDGKVSYSSYRDKAIDKGVSRPNYYSIAEELMEDQVMLYKEGLLRSGIEERVEKNLEILDSKRDRELHYSEVEAVISTAMKHEDSTPRMAIDREKLTSRIKVKLDPRYSPSGEALP